MSILDCLQQGTRDFPLPARLDLADGETLHCAQMLRLLPGKRAVMAARWRGRAVLVSRNGATHMGFALAEELGVTLIARAKSRQFVALNAGNLVFDQPPGKRGEGKEGGTGRVEGGAVGGN